jgi:hypothetical protein
MAWRGSGGSEATQGEAGFAGIACGREAGFTLPDVSEAWSASRPLQGALDFQGAAAKICRSSIVFFRK